MRTNTRTSYDAIIVGAGFSGLYLLWKLRGQGLNVRVFEAGDDVGGTWFWNRYPGARCDVESVDYSFSFDDQLQQEWRWKERYPAQPEILEYLQHVADRFDLRRDISLETRVQSAHYDEDAGIWTVRAGDVEEVTARFVIMATGCLSVPQTPNIPGLETFAGETYHTGYWPKAGVDLSGKRVAVIGTGSSGIQLIPEVAKVADHLTVLQRTASFSVPALNGPLDPEFEREVKANYPERRRRARASSAGVERGDNEQNALDVAYEDRVKEFDGRWGKGGFALLGAYQDLMLTDEANDTVADYVRAKIRATVEDPETADALVPRGYPLGAKRICVDTNYFETYNRDNVTLVDLRKSPLESITPTGARTEDADYEFDVLCLATGFDAMTGALDRIDITGVGGETLKNKWQHGPTTYLGLGVAGFPNLLLIAGSGSPSVLANMVTAIEQHVEWTAELLGYMSSHGYDTIEPTPEVEEGWVAHVNEMASYTVFPKAASWYIGANIPGKPQIFMPYVGGCVEYEKKCNEVAANDYSGFALR